MAKTTSTPNDDLPRMMAEAESLVAAVEALPLGEAYAEPFRLALASIRILGDAARPLIFPAGVVPIGRDVLADVEAYAEGSSGVALAHLHESAIETYPELAAALRTRAFVDKVRRHGADNATFQDPRVPKGVTARLAGQEAVERFEASVSGQLAARGLAQPASGALALAPVLRARLEAANDRLAAHAREEQERLVREDAEAQALLLDARRESLSAWFELQYTRPFDVPTGDWPTTSGGALAEAIRRGRLDLDQAEKIREAFISRVRRDAEAAGIA